MKIRRLFLSIIFVFFTFIYPKDLEARDFIKRDNSSIHVIDQASVLNDSQKREFTNTCGNLKSDHNIDMFFLIIQKLESGENIISLSNKIGDILGIGKNNNNRGIVILFSRDDKKLRISTSANLKNSGDCKDEDLQPIYEKAMLNLFGNERGDILNANAFNLLATDILNNSIRNKKSYVNYFSNWSEYDILIWSVISVIIVLVIVILLLIWLTPKRHITSYHSSGGSNSSTLIVYQDTQPSYNDVYDAGGGVGGGFSDGGGVGGD